MPARFTGGKLADPQLSSYGIYGRLYYTRTQGVNNTITYGAKRVENVATVVKRNSQPWETIGLLCDPFFVTYVELANWNIAP